MTGPVFITGASRGIGKQIALAMAKSGAKIGLTSTKNEDSVIYVYLEKIIENNTEEDLDTDGDGLVDSEEEKFGTDSNNVDTDGDGYSDFDEINAGYNPLGEGRIANI